MMLVVKTMNKTLEINEEMKYKKKSISYVNKFKFFFVMK